MVIGKSNRVFLAGVLFKTVVNLHTILTDDVRIDTARGGILKQMAVLQGNGSQNLHRTSRKCFLLPDGSLSGGSTGLSCKTHFPDTAHSLRKGTVLNAHDQVYGPAMSALAKVIPAVLVFENLETRRTVTPER